VSSYCLAGQVGGGEIGDVKSGDGRLPPLEMTARCYLGLCAFVSLRIDVAT
jgi:hypothetical protein